MKFMIFLLLVNDTLLNTSVNIMEGNFLLHLLVTVIFFHSSYFGVVPSCINKSPTFDNDVGSISNLFIRKFKYFQSFSRKALLNITLFLLKYFDFLIKINLLG